jgi:hypothetical protein
VTAGTTFRHQLSMSDIIQLVNAGSLALPDFQRPFQWGAQEVRSFLATILMGWPAGSLLLMEAPPRNFFAMRAFHGAPGLERDAVRHLVLDGQQRITTIYSTFGPAHGDDTEWCIRLEKWKDHEDVESLEAALVLLPRGAWRSSGASLLPVRSLLNDRSFMDWRNEELAMFESDETLARYSALNRLWSGRLSNVQRYSLTAEVLPKKMSLSSVSKIFERLNTSGMPLGTFDLVAAHVYRDGRNLRSAWERVVAANPAIALIAADDAQLVVETVALTKHGDTRRSMLLDLEADELWDSWEDVVRGLDQAAQFMIQHAGVSNRSELPHRGILLVLAALGGKFDLTAHADSLRYWLFCTALGARFDAAVNTRVVKDYRLLHDVLSNSKEMPDLMPDHTALVRATRRSSASAWLGVQAVLRWNEATDAPLELFDGLFAVDLLRPVPITAPAAGNQRASDPVASVLLLGQRSESVLEHRGAKVLREVLLTLPEKEVAAFCDAQLVPLPSDSAYASDATFVQRRAQLIEARVRNLSLPSALNSVDLSSVADKRQHIVDLAAARLGRGEPQEAVQLLRRVLDDDLSQPHLPVGFSQDVVNLSSAYYLSGREAEALAVLTLAHRRLVEERGVADVQSLEVLDALVDACYSATEFKASVELARGLLSGLGAVYGTDSALALRAGARVVRGLVASGDIDGARAEWRAALRLARSAGGTVGAAELANLVVDGLLNVGQLRNAQTFLSWASLSATELATSGGARLQALQTEFGPSPVM